VLDQILDLIQKLPDFVKQFGELPIPQLAGLFVVAVGLFVVSKVGRMAPALANTCLVAGLLSLLFVLGAIALKATRPVVEHREQVAFIHEHQPRDGERRLIVSSLYQLGLGQRGDAGSMEGAAADRAFYIMLAQVLEEDLPESIPAPSVVAIDFGQRGSPWRPTVGPENFHQVLVQLRSAQILWGDMDRPKGVAHLFLGGGPFASLPETTPIDEVVPLSDLPLGGNPRDVRYGDGYYCLLGHVALAAALDTLHQAETTTSAEDKKRLFLRSAQQVQDAQAQFVNGRNNKVLSRNLYDRGKQIIAYSLAKAGVAPP
jgi:hypothetical protein